MRNEVFQFLTTPKNLKARIACIDVQIQDLRLMMLPSAIRYDKDKVQTSPEDPMLKYAERLDELERKKAALQKQYLTAQEAVSRAINCLADPYEAQVLTMRYVGNKRFDDIIEAMPFASATVYRMHKEGLKHINSFLEKNKVDSE